MIELIGSFELQNRLSVNETWSRSAFEESTQRDTFRFSYRRQTCRYCDTVSTLLINVPVISIMVMGI